MEECKCEFPDMCDKCLDKYERDFNRRQGIMTEANEVYGWDLNNGLGFKDFNDAETTLDPDHVNWGSLWKISGSVYQLIRVADRPFFRKEG